MRAGSGGGAWKYQTSMGPNQCLPECSALRVIWLKGCGMKRHGCRPSNSTPSTVTHAVPVDQFSFASIKNVWFDDDEGLFAFCTGACLSTTFNGPACQIS